MKALLVVAGVVFGVPLAVLGAWVGVAWWAGGQVPPVDAGDDAWRYASYAGDFPRGLERDDAGGAS